MCVHVCFSHLEKKMHQNVNYQFNKNNENKDFFLPYLSTYFLFVLNNMPILLGNKKKKNNNEETDIYLH